MEQFSFDWWIFSENNWERVALTKLVEGFGWRASGVDKLAAKSGEVSNTKPNGIIVILSSADGYSSLLNRAVEQHSNVPIVVCLHGMEEGDDGFEFPQNVRAVITSNMSEAAIQSLLLLVSEGHRIFSHEADSNNHEIDKNGNVQSMISAIALSTLTKREGEISCEICSGKSNKEIARKLNITVNTVNVHLNSIRRKLGVSNRTMIAMKLSGGFPRALVKKKFRRSPANLQMMSDGRNFDLLN